MPSSGQCPPLPTGLPLRGLAPGVASPGLVALSLPHDTDEWSHWGEDGEVKGIQRKWKLRK